MNYYKVQTQNGVDFSLAIPLTQYGFDDYIFFTLNKKVNNPKYIEITQDEYETELANRLPKEPEPEPIEEPTQLDRIEAKLDKSKQDIIDEYTLELIEGGVLA